MEIVLIIVGQTVGANGTLKMTAAINQVRLYHINQICVIVKEIKLSKKPVIIEVV